jgi:anti-sigma regulatory factor (Ser/Thr protein kinase)
MPHEYTRQRQGRDFSLTDYLTNSAAANRMESEIRKAADEAHYTLISRLEHFKEEAERNAVPIDGNEPPERKELHK